VIDVLFFGSGLSGLGIPEKKKDFHENMCGKKHADLFRWPVYIVFSKC